MAYKVGGLVGPGRHDDVVVLVSRGNEGDARCNKDRRIFLSDEKGMESFFSRQKMSSATEGRRKEKRDRRERTER